MYGALIGDIIGSRFEFCNLRFSQFGEDNINFELFEERCNFTDDSVMTIAVADALLTPLALISERRFKSVLVNKMHSWALKYPGVGYGDRFGAWVLTKDKKVRKQPYGSWGNGSAMRVSPVGLLFDTAEETCRVARWTAEVSHSHPEGVKGAEATALAVYLARTGVSKEDIRRTIQDKFDYDLSRTVLDIGKNYRYYVDCARSVPEALICVLAAESYEEAIRNIVWIGGDTDTLAAIGGGVAELLYGIPDDILEKGMSYFDFSEQKIMDKLYKKGSWPCRN